MSKTKRLEMSDKLVIVIGLLLGAACVGALVQGLYLTITTNEFAKEQFGAALAGLVAVVLTMIPGIIERTKLLPMPAFLKVFYSVFVYLAMFFGEILHFYDTVAWWDVMLHFASGVLFSLVGYLVFMAMNKGLDIRAKISPAIIVMFSVIFAIACGVVWEIFEFGADCLIGANMQRWQNTISPEQWAAMQNVTNLSNPGLMDTMKDFIMDTAGALLSIPVVLRIAKKINRYTKTDITIEELTQEFKPVAWPKSSKPAPAPVSVMTAMGVEYKDISSVVYQP